MSRGWGQVQAAVRRVEDPGFRRHAPIESERCWECGEAMRSRMSPHCDACVARGVDGGWNAQREAQERAYGLMRALVAIGGRRAIEPCSRCYLPSHCTHFGSEWMCAWCRNSLEEQERRLADTLRLSEERSAWGQYLRDSGFYEGRKKRWGER